MIVRGTKLQMTRGDSESITLKITNSDKTPYKFEVGDKVYFTVKLHANTKEILIQKIITKFGDDDVIIIINPDDTKDLRYNTYVYDAQLTKKDGTVKTIIPFSEFKITEEVTYE